MKDKIYTPEVHWLSSRTCDLCGGKCGAVLYDFRVPGDGRWAVGCHSCFTAYRGLLGVGMGQKYRLREADDTYVKVGG